MTKARTNASATPAVGRNMVINGSMNVAARLGENAFVNSIGASAGYFTVDRFKFAMGSTATAGRLKMRWFDDGPAGISNKCIKLECTTADTSIAAAEALTLFTTLEDIDCVRTGHGTASAQQITVSFYVKGNANATYVVQLLNNQHSGFIHNNRLFSVTTDWTRVEVTFQADTTSDSEFGVTNAGGFSLGWILHAGTGQTSATLASNWATGGTNRAAGGESFFDSTDNTFQLTGVQMEVGPVATEFEQETEAVTLSKCQRYCQRHPVQDQLDDGTYSMLGSAGWASSTTVGLQPTSLPTTMRLEPTATFSGNWRFVHANTATAISSGPTIIDVYSNAGAVYITGTVGSTALTAGAGLSLTQNNDVDAHLILDSEL